MKLASVSLYPSLARRQLHVEPLEDRSVPGSILGLSALDSQLGVLAQAALGPVTALAIVASTAQEGALPVITQTPGALSSSVAAVTPGTRGLVRQQAQAPQGVP